MKLPENKIIIEKSSQFMERRSKIGNLSIVLNILRNKLYSNVIESITREISCNARDANREVSKGNIPIEIHFPNAFDNNYRICDNGPGISPQRMDEVYMNYGNSTKRDSNEFTGAFGLGSKTPLAYSNQFTIKTTTEENNIFTTRTYIYYIDESNEGILALVSEENLNLSSGTEIIIPVEEKDFESFITSTLKSTQYWPIKPILKGINPVPEYPQTIGDLLASGENWNIYNVKNNSGFYNSTKAESLAIIDGIQYKIDESFIASDDRWILQSNVHMIFNIGELSLSASREAIQYDDNTIKLINNKIKLIKKELSEQISELIDKKETYVEAVEFYEFMEKYFYRILKNKDFLWRGNKVIGEDVDLRYNVLKNIKSNIYGFRKHTSNYRTSIKRDFVSKLHINKKTEIYYNDLDPNHTYRNKNIKALENNNYIQIINYLPNKTYDDFVNDYKSESAKFIQSNEVDNSFILDIIKPKLLSSIIEDKQIKVKSTIKVIKPLIKNKIKVYKYNNINNYVSYRLRDNFSEDFIEKDTEGYYVQISLSNNKHNNFICKYKSKNWKFSINDINCICKLLKDESIYFVNEKFISKFTKLKPLSELIEKKFNELISDDYYNFLSIMLINNDSYKRHNSFLSDLNKLKTFNNKILNNNSLFLKYSKILTYSKDININNFLIKFENLINDNKKLNIFQKKNELLIEEMESRYKLLNFISNEASCFDIIDYINACDKKLVHKETKPINIAVGA